MIKHSIGNNGSGLTINKSYDAERLEDKLTRMMYNGEEVDIETSRIIYTERKDGVHAGHDIRTDRFEVAIDAMDKVAKSYKAKREDGFKKNFKIEKGANEDKNTEDGLGADVTQATN